MYLTHEELTAALRLRDLTDPLQGEHALQQLVADVLERLTGLWGIPVRLHRGERVVTVDDNYDALAYPADGPARDRRYTRYVDETRLLRTHTSASIPGALRELGGRLREELIAVPGLVYRRDAIDRLHVGEPHQLDLWRLAAQPLGSGELELMVAAVVDALVPGARRRALAATHPYTLDGLEVEVLRDGEWVELLECGLAHPHVLAGAGLEGYGLAMGIGLDRALMLRKGVRDIRLLRSGDPRVAAQMLTLDPYAEVSAQPPAKRDLSIACVPGLGAEELGDRVRRALGKDAELVEHIELLSRTPAAELSHVARERLGMRRGQENLLVRVVVRHPTRSVSRAEANLLRDRIYRALHEGEQAVYAGGG
jgi:phenylalanyl-tRNA synthetase alpha chain